MMMLTTFNFSFYARKYTNLPPISQWEMTWFSIIKIFKLFFWEKFFLLFFVANTQFLTGTILYLFLFSLTSEGNTRCIYSYEKKMCSYMCLLFCFPSLTFHLPIWKFIFYLLYLDTILPIYIFLFYPMLNDDKNFKTCYEFSSLPTSRKFLFFLVKKSSHKSFHD